MSQENPLNPFIAENLIDTLYDSVTLRSLIGAVVSKYGGPQGATFTQEELIDHTNNMDLYIELDPTADMFRLYTSREQLEAPKGEPPRKKNFGDALNALRCGERVRRSGWNGKNMWLHVQTPDSGSKMTLPYIYMKTADAQLVPWLASQTDLLAFDWEVL